MAQSDKTRIVEVSQLDEGIDFDQRIQLPSLTLDGFALTKGQPFNRRKFPT
jgi:hypothetical protein